MDNFFDFVMYVLSSIVITFNSIIDWFEYTVGDFIDQFNFWLPWDNWFDNLLLELLENIDITGVPLPSVSILMFMLGSGLFFYLVYQFISWLTNIAT